MTIPAIAFVVAEFDRGLSEAMLGSAAAEAKKLGARVVVTVRVPGSYEVPLAAESLLARSDVDALVALGYIERGETQHGQVMGQVVHGALIDASLRYGKPVGLGFIGPGATRRQAKKRKTEYAESAVRAALKMLTLLPTLRPPAEPTPVSDAPAKARGKRKR